MICCLLNCLSVIVVAWFILSTMSNKCKVLWNAGEIFTEIETKSWTLDTRDNPVILIRYVDSDDFILTTLSSVTCSTRNIPRTYKHSNDLSCVQQEIEYHYASQITYLQSKRENVDMLKAVTKPGHSSGHFSPNIADLCALPWNVDFIVAHLIGC